MYALLKTIHISCVLLTIAGFLLRAYWMQSGSSLINHRSTRIAPHIIDTLLLASGIALIFEINLAVMSQSWLFAKIAGIIVYILLGLFAMRFARTRHARMLAFVTALAVFAYVAGTAVAKSPASWLAYLFS